MKPGRYKARKSFSAELDNGCVTNFTKGVLYYLEIIDGGYFVEDDYRQLVKFSKEEFEDIFERKRSLWK